MPWEIAFHPAFRAEVDELAPAVQDSMFAMLIALQEHGPRLGRPNVDTLNGSAFTNMKELRFRAERGAWRVAFAFDPQRRGILLVAGDKAGVPGRKFYKRLIAKADARFKEHLRHVAIEEQQ